MNICPHCRLFLRELLISAIAAYSFIIGINIPVIIIILVAFLPLYSSYGTFTSAFEALTLVMPVILLSFFTDNRFASYLPVMTAFLLLIAIRSGKRWTFALTILFTAIWVYFALNMPFGVIDIILITLSVLTIFMNIGFMKGKGVGVKSIDIFNRSITGKTADFTKYFAKGAKKLKCGVNIINYDESKTVEFNSEGLVIAFPVHIFGCGMEFLRYILRTIPKSCGKPAFIIYSATLYPDIAYIFVWLILRLKGYDVMGRLWLASAAHDFTHDNDMAAEAGGDFADGWRAGMPFILYPSPLSLIGLLIKK